VATEFACVHLFRVNRRLWEIPAEEAKAALQAVPNYYMAAPVKRQLKTVHGELVCIDKGLAESKEYSVANPCGPAVPVFAKTDLTIIGAIERHVFEVVLPDGSHWCNKEVYRRSDSVAFAREAHQLAGLPPHPHIISLHGVATNQDGKVDGLLLTLLKGKALSTYKSVSPECAAKWKMQLKSALQHVHAHKIGPAGNEVPRVWGDAKTDNIIIMNSGDLVIMDFDGSRTDGWVDKDLMETEAGDQQGYSRICSWLDGITETPPV